MESFHAASGSFPRRFARSPSPYGSHPSAEPGSWVDHDLGPPHPPFMAQGNGSQPSRNGHSPTPSFRAPFSTPSSRWSSVWFPPSHVTNTPNSLTAANPSYVASEVLSRVSTLLSEKLTWLNQPPDARTCASRWITLLMIFLGACSVDIVCWSGYRDARNTMIPPNRLCLAMEDNFDNFDVDNGGIWTRDVEMSGFGNGEFEMATALSDNSFVRNGQLHIKPALTSNALSNPQQIFDGGFRVAQRDECPPYHPGQPQHSFRRSRSCVVAKLPRGDWLWPAIWMAPLDSVYGPWPLSGEIDIMEARGNAPSYPGQGVNFSLKRTNYAQGFHTYTLEWTENIKIYVDSRLRNSGGFFWKRGNFPLTAHNTAEEIVVPNPWTIATAKSATNATPFDQFTNWTVKSYELTGYLFHVAFYLILDLAVGGTSGWFPDKVGNKPWFDGSASAMRDFASQQSTWSATWPSNDDDLYLELTLYACRTSVEHLTRHRGQLDALILDIDGH
ncbi:concanavalin A-like lectin/glucanase domain-containing protein [Lactifluus subvellereus]|nr:concanavalin A-like lectin/glucanase domain-containing protein [Lactifluus subvellereus]